jgi:hypothetical protein
MRALRMSAVVVAVLQGCGFDPVVEACPAGTVRAGTLCVAASAVTCGAGTDLVGQTCVASVVCGTGTPPDGGLCVTGLSCGAGTTLQGTVCVATGGTTCGAGTALQGTVCVATGGTTCGPGTGLQGTVCVPVGGISCGPGTALQDSVCLPVSGVTCGPGTVLSGTECLPGDGARYELRLATSQVPGDGLSKIPLFAVGILADGTPATDQVVVSVIPSYRATVTPGAFTLGALGSTGTLVACNALTSVACAGDAELTLALASAPALPVARFRFTVSTPSGVGTAAPCLVGGNVLYFDGDPNYVFSGVQTVTAGSWSGSLSTTTAHVGVTPADSSQGLWWDVDLTAPDGNPLVVGVYENAQRWPFQAPTHPGLDVSGDGRGCNTVSGRFQVEELTATSLTATFEHHCEGGSAALRGCVHWSQ